MIEGNFISVFHSRIAPRKRADPESVALYFLQFFILLQIACQLTLLVGPTGLLRIFCRSAAFSGSLFLLAFLPLRGARHPAWGWGVAVLAMVGFGFLHPGTPFLAGLAQAALYFGILGPLFWVPRLAVTQAVLQRVLVIMWGFHTLSAAFGVLQVEFPGRFQPNVSSVVTGFGAIADGLKIELANGERVWRPMGLTDQPGGAANAGLYAILFGAGFLLTSRSKRVLVLAAGGIGLGLFCIYLCQIRSALVVAGVCVVVLMVLLMRRGEFSRAMGLAAIGGFVAVLSTLWAFSVGGDAVTRRLSTLVEGKPGEVYYRNRGHFLEDTVYRLAPTYPLGAGLARWGMMNVYFADKDDLDRPPIYVEIQWTGWLLDGGIPLVLCYAAALLCTTWFAWRMALRPGDDALAIWAAVILAYDLGALATTFNYPLFIGQGGMEFWLLNATLFAAAQNRSD